MNLIAGIDPGLGGAIALLCVDGTYFSVIDMPVMASGPNATVKRRVNAAAVAHYLSCQQFSPNLHCKVIHAVIERVSSRPGEGVCSVFSFGLSAGMVEGAVAALDIPYELITPHEWKKWYGLTSDKEQSRAKAIQLYPSAPLELRKHEGRAEALLLTLYALKKLQHV